MRDIFGYALHCYWKGDRKTPHIIRRDDDNVDESSLKKYFTKEFHPTEKTVEHDVTGKILDVGSGEGIFGRSLSNQFKVINLDIPGAEIKNPDVIKKDFFVKRKELLLENK